MSGIPIILSTIAFVICGQLILKKGMNAVGAISLQQIKSPFLLAKRIGREPYVIAGFSLYGLSAVSWVYVLSQNDLSYAYPFMALAYAGVTTAATLLFKESFSLLQWLGLGVVIAGVAIVASTAS